MPGTYTVSLTVGDETFSSDVDIAADPRRPMTVADRRARQDAEEAAKMAEFDAVAQRLADVKVSTKAKADESGSLYGSVGAAQVAELLTQAGHPTDEKAVRLDAPLKSVGDHAVAIHLFGDRNVDVTVTIEAEE